MGICSFSVAGLMIIPDAMVAAVSDLEEKVTGRRREALYFGTQGFFMKLNLGLSTTVSSTLLQFFGIPLGIQLTGPVAAVFILVGLLIFTSYPEDTVTAAQKRFRQKLG